jgi:hypothetical protein
VVYVRVIAAEAPAGDAVYRSLDGGASWTKLLQVSDFVTAFLARADGETIIIGTKTDGVHLSTNRGDSFVDPAAQPQMGCIGERADGTMFACADTYL